MFYRSNRSFRFAKRGFTCWDTCDLVGERYLATEIGLYAFIPGVFDSRPKPCLDICCFPFSFFKLVGENAEWTLSFSQIFERLFPLSRKLRFEGVHWQDGVSAIFWTGLEPLSSLSWLIYQWELLLSKLGFIISVATDEKIYKVIARLYPNFWSLKLKIIYIS